MTSKGITAEFACRVPANPSNAVGRHAMYSKFVDSTVTKTLFGRSREEIAKMPSFVKFVD